MLPVNSLVGVWGVGREGASVTRYLLGRGHTVIAVDEGAAQRPEGLPAAAQFCSGADALNTLLECAAVVVSPGVPRVHPFREDLTERGILVTTPTALWMQENFHNVVGVTGTKGKSTTASLAQYILAEAGVRGPLAGNIGVPVTDIGESAPVVVAELSSYQCAYLESSPRVAVVTNLFQDHLTWHGSLSQYWLDKAKVFSEGAEVLVCSQTTLDVLRSLPVTIPRVVKTTEDPSLSVLEGLPVPGVLSSAHNLENLKLALLAAAEVTTFSIPAAVASLDEFSGLPHRLQTVSQRDSRTWVDDSLATTAESVIAAVNSFVDQDLVLLVGGQDRGIDYAPLNAVLASRTPPVKVVCLPDNGRAMVAAYQGLKPETINTASTMEEAVSLARQISAPGSIIVLSPGAPSFNLYKDFEEKSKHFLRAVSELEVQ